MAHDRDPIVFKLTCSHSSIARYLCVELVDMQEVHARTQGSRVFWDRFWKHDTRDTSMDHGGNMSNRDTKNDLEVLVTMSGFQHQTKHKEFYLAFLQDKIGPT